MDIKVKEQRGLGLHDLGRFPVRPLATAIQTFYSALRVSMCVLWWSYLTIALPVFLHLSPKQVHFLGEVILHPMLDKRAFLGVHDVQGQTALHWKM